MCPDSQTSEYRALYKPAYASDMLNGRPNLMCVDNGNIRLSGLASHHGGDVSMQGAVYWYLNKEVAER